MALPWLIGLGVAALVAAVVISTLSDFFDKVDEKKKELKAAEAKISSLYKDGKYNKVKISFNKNGKIVGHETVEVTDEVAQEIYVGQTR
ncbi:hypothetical protein [Helicobacter brantae]|uniref:Uncharacterized protein n=1 Tax=Helicobacter brantae TaxID=375927 RepID=A0A3D8J4K3_9HELI|nr:hypothetical protein [Helicobacter brantae]RDU71804.1 hypothetical protein CQA58_01815 [Helicobacter brantae]